MSILRDLGLPALAQHDAYSDALMTAMMYLTLEDYQGPRRPHPPGARQAGRVLRRLSRTK